MVFFNTKLPLNNGHPGNHTCKIVAHPHILKTIRNLTTCHYERACIHMNACRQLNFHIKLQLIRHHSVKKFLRFTLDVGPTQVHMLPIPSFYLCKAWVHKDDTCAQHSCHTASSTVLQSKRANFSILETFSCNA